ncbi:hypothetical protein A5819_001978 [Enterococcus sp. 7E2_DIV0204]|uniref:capsular polysaccharide synthesis protein n=1 Tax=Enterococcus sp. 7E2_DIV0204 TaxID=1834188 RepID=UPI000A32C7E0|nr:capsular polysaccharide synthesis protein [Enterococcus sp. 7E2_DIV0204]OTN89486.1 hypothetical protein A5819_001978 [Enterococcus sp. 7E2_DIV0204]
MNSKSNLIYRLSKSTFIISKTLRKMNVNPFFSRKFNKRRHERNLAYLRNKYSNTIDKYKNISTVEYDRYSNNKYIWVLWLQGERMAPAIVQSCIKSIRQNTLDCEVIILSEENLGQYITMSDIIMQKLEDGTITYTHFSDIVRFNLLRSYGGLWMDATLLTVSPLNREYFSSFYTSGPYQDKEFFNVSEGKWTGFLIGGPSNDALFHFMYDFFLTYWENEEKLIDYFLIDYGLEIAYLENIGGLRFFVENRGLSNPNLFELAPYLGQEYSEKKFLEMKKDTDLFKLSYKINEKTIDKTDKTFYGQLIGDN